MPSVMWYLIIMLVVIVFWFLALKRPVYEAVLVAFLVLVTLSGTWPQIGAFVEKGTPISLISLYEPGSTGLGSSVMGAPSVILYNA